ncbi:Sugar and other transporter [Aspergillus sp. HF37]|nr:Sugar and other transporter [Aspergillus sp. HF37]
MPVQRHSGAYKGRRIKNPLTSRTPDELDKDVQKFYERQQLDTAVDLDTLVKGARIARDPWNLSGRAVPGITAAERKAIEQEKDASFFQQSKQLKVTILTTACAAIIQ